MARGPVKFQRSLIEEVEDSSSTIVPRESELGIEVEGPIRGSGRREASNDGRRKKL